MADVVRVASYVCFRRSACDAARLDMVSLNERCSLCCELLVAVLVLL